MGALPFDVANFNLINFANIYPDLMDSVPKDVTYQYKDANGNIQTVTIANRGKFKQQLWDDVGGALGQFNRTFYVDADNGDDNNDGSSDAPFATLQKAVDSVPIGGFGHIILNSNYDGIFNSALKNIYIEIASDKTWKIPDGQRNLVNGCSVGILNYGHLYVEKLDSDSNNSGDNNCAFFVTDYEKYPYLAQITNVYLVNIDSSNPIKVDNDRYLAGSRNWGTSQGMQINLAVYNIKCSDDFTLDGKLLFLRNGAGSFQWNNLNNDDSFKVVDSDGNAVDITTTVDGIIKDSNGVPRNIISNIIF